MLRLLTLRSSAVPLFLVMLLTGLSGPAQRTRAAPVEPALAAFLAMGGTLADLCLHAPGAGPAGGRDHCDACRLIPPVLPPERLVPERRARFARAAQWRAGRIRRGTRLRRPGEQRAPPDLAD
jgi:hypothetical protein